MKEIKTGYCPICDETLKTFSDKIMIDCPRCGHSVVLHTESVRKENDNTEYKTIFVVTVFEKCEPNDKYFADIGSIRSPCFRYTFESAEEVVKTNMCDILEYCYDYAVIHEIGCELYPCCHMRKFYKYNKDIDGYEPIEEPECLKHIDFCGIG